MGEVPIYDRKVLSKPSPFAQISYSKDRRIEIFVGRQRELGEMRQWVQNVAETRSSKAIKLTGPGGSGKSTLFGYLKQQFFSGPAVYPELEVLIEYHIIVALIDAPEGEPSFKAIWSAICDSLEGQELSFFNMIASQLFIKVISILLSYPNARAELMPVIQELRLLIRENDDAAAIKRNLMYPDVCQALFEKPEAANTLMQIISKYSRVIGRDKVQLGSRTLYLKYRPNSCNIFQIYSKVKTSKLQQK